MQHSRKRPSNLRVSYVIDAADKEAIPIAKEELRGLLDKSVLQGIPLLVLGNKSDLPDKLSVDDLIEKLDLTSIRHREVSCYGISAKEEQNLDAVLSCKCSVKSFISKCFHSTKDRVDKRVMTSSANAEKMTFNLGKTLILERFPGLINKTAH